jgi:undecaprenyl-diphosphatase
VLPALLGWHLDLQSQSFLPFLVMLHVGTAIALLGFFWRDWLAIIRGVLGLAGPHEVAEARRVFGLIVIATIPVLILGFLLEHPLRRIFATPLIAAVFLVVNGLLLLVGERLKGRPAELRALSSLRPMDAFVIGLWQCLALIPGLSRSGVTILGGVLRGVDHEGSAHFSFLIATPVIVAAAVLEVPKLLHDTAAGGAMSLALVSAVVAGVTALASTAFLMRWFRGHDSWAMTPFALYCVVAGIGSVGFLLLAR